MNNIKSCACGKNYKLKKNGEYSTYYINHIKKCEKYLAENKQKDNQEEQKEKCNECSICFDELSNKKNIHECKKCKNMFHKTCIDIWKKKSTTCPICRTVISHKICHNQQINHININHNDIYDDVNQNNNITEVINNRNNIYCKYNNNIT